MCFAFSFIPATIWLIIGFFVLFTASKAQGNLKLFGRVLGTWALVIALIFPTMGAYVTFSGACPIPAMIEIMHAQSNS